MPSLPPPEIIENNELLGVRSGVVNSSGDWKGQAVFVKTLVNEGADCLDRFSHEGEVAAALSHPGTTTLLKRTQTQLIFEFIEGGTLRDLVRCGPMSADQTTQVAWGILATVQYLHEAGITHHDLKPENVLLKNGEATASAVKIIDFGMSHSTHLDSDVCSRTRMGTPHFMAPEQFQGIRGDLRSDLYSVGVLMFDCLAGHPPYEDALGWLVGIQTECAELPGPKVMHPLMLSALKRDVEKRPQSASEMFIDLAQVRHILGLEPIV